MQSDLRSQMRKSLKVGTYRPYLIVGGCCRNEVELLATATYDWERLGVLAPVSDPALANLMICAGYLSESALKEAERAYCLLAGEKWVIAVGACAISGSPYALKTNTAQRLDEKISVDAFVPGCPPRPEVILEAIYALSEKVRPKVNQRKILQQALKESVGELP
ncbi:MAG: hypothetical protein COT74_06515 [Bdellovibrionales bacterium CG10_big_fil_rev_8_21_14_0_10_45_34]|nr:MAG: hypothetical protein COT74_06515 [Bdellovibrionales bacterium CG10_big_fil_rev_8_21_14_0_10_45_34]